MALAVAVAFRCPHGLDGAGDSGDEPIAGYCVVVIEQQHRRLLPIWRLCVALEWMGGLFCV